MAHPCTCQACVLACKRLPGAFKPGEAEKAAALLGMPWPEFRERFLILDYWIGNQKRWSSETPLGQDIYVWTPRREGVDDARRIAQSLDLTFARCTFLNASDLCSIHGAKPHECRMAMCCAPKQSGNNLRWAVVNAWKKLGNPLARLRGWSPWPDDAGTLEWCKRVAEVQR